MTKKLIIVGGGYLGAELAKTLEAHLDVTLIEARHSFVHTPAMIRAMVDPSLLDRALMRYDKLLKKGRVLHARVSSVDGEGVTLDDGSRHEADYIVMATGSTNGSFTPAADSIDEFRAVVADVHAKLKAAKTVAIVGAGTVGTELAGEISHAMPEKTVTLISDQARLLPQMPLNFGKSLTQKLKEAGVDVRFGVSVQNLESLTTPYAGTLSLSDGTSLVADLIIPAIGARAVTKLFEGMPGVSKEKNGRVKVDKYLRPSIYPKVFAAGDAASTGDAMTAVAVGRQVSWLAKTLKALAGGKRIDQLKVYVPWSKSPLIVPLGPVRGCSFMVVASFGDCITSNIKGKDLFIGKYRKVFGLKKTAQNLEKQD